MTLTKRQQRTVATIIRRNPNADADFLIYEAYMHPSTINLSEEDLRAVAKEYGLKIARRQRKAVPQYA